MDVRVRVWLCMGGMQSCPQSTLSLCGTTLLATNNDDLGTYHNSRVERQSGLAY